MIKNILVPLTGFDGDGPALEAAYLIGAPFAANIVCHHVQPDPMRIVARAAVGQFGTALGGVELLHALEKEGEARTAKARKAFDEFSKRRGLGALSGNGATAAWCEIEGDPVADTITEARYSDLVVLGRPSEDGEFTTDEIAGVLVACGRPVLLAPQTPLKTLGANIAIAWKETAEAARAVSAAMPVLAHAKRVVVISADEAEPDAEDAAKPAERLAVQLTRHGLPAEARNLAWSSHPVGDALLQAARAAGADLLVMGAYSHNRFRELVFGGFTRHILKDCTLPVMLLH